PRSEAQFLGERGFAGDRSFEAGHHTPNMDVHAFSLDHYPHYEGLAGKPFAIPSFGENLSLRGGIDTDVCIGDLFAAGTALLEVSQPTERCGTPGRSAGVPALRKWIFECLYTGYYLRVVRTGWVRRGDELLLRERRLPDWTVDRVNRAMYERFDDAEQFEAMLALPLLSSDWKDRANVLRERRRAAQQRPA
ncbi:MAG: MOSC domain-containing protein, partial [Candidatus Eremiobacteraeota bacterium]|nr:MOSC domain-containing protein [Candidatus Eremiobacteraeota bacterium]